RPAFGAAAKRKPRDDHAEDQYPPSQHENPPVPGWTIKPQVGHFQAGQQRSEYVAKSLSRPKRRKGITSKMQQQGSAGFGIEEARRVLGEVFAPWVQDLKLSVEAIEFDPPPQPAADWQPGAILRMPFSERLCRNGGMVSGQAVGGFADTPVGI